MAGKKMSLNFGPIIEQLKEFRQALISIASGNDAAKVIEQLGRGAKTAELSLNKHVQTLEKNIVVQRELNEVKEQSLKTEDRLVKIQAKVASETDKATKAKREQKSEISRLKKQVEELTSSATKSSAVAAKDMASMLRAAFYGEKSNTRTTLATFFKNQFKDLGSIIQTAVSGIKIQNISMDIGKNLGADLADGIKKNTKSAQGAISGALTAFIQSEFQRIEKEVRVEIRKIAKDIGIKSEQDFREAFKNIKNQMAYQKDLSTFQDIQKFGMGKKQDTQKQFKDQLKDIASHYSTIERMTSKHSLELTRSQRERAERIENAMKKAQKAFNEGFSGDNIKKNMAALDALAKRMRKFEENQRQSFNTSKADRKAITDHEALEREKMKISYKSIMATVRTQERASKQILNIMTRNKQEIQRLNTGFSKNTVAGQVGKKPSEYVISTAEEKQVQAKILTIQESLRQLQKAETISVEERVGLLKLYQQEYDTHTNLLVKMINERVAANKKAASDDKQALKDLAKEVQDNTKVEKDRIKALVGRLDAAKTANKKHYDTRMKEHKNFIAEYTASEEKMYDRLRRIKGNFTEKEKATKKSTYLQHSIDSAVRAEVEQANKIQRIVDLKQKALQKSIAAGPENEFFKNRVRQLNDLARIEMEKLDETIYARQNGAKQHEALLRKQAEDEKKSLAEKNQARQAAEQINAETLKQRAEMEAKQRKADEEALKQTLDIKEKAYSNFRRSVIRFSKEVGIGWNSTNLVRSFTTTAHAIRRSGHDIGVVLKDLAKRAAYAAAAITGIGVAAGAMAAVATKKFVDFGKSVMTATEEIRGYNIALYGMMQTYGGVNDMMETALRVTRDMPIGFQTLQESLKGLVLIGPVRDMLRDAEDVEGAMGRLFKIVVGLAQIQPQWGAKGAIFSLRNALTGDLRSLQRRFELPVRAIYSQEGVPLQDLQWQPEKMIETLSDYVGSFYSEETLNMSNRQLSKILEKIHGNWVRFLSRIGESGFYDVVVADFLNVRDTIQELVDSPTFNKYAEQISNAMANIYEAVRNVAKYTGGNLSKMFNIDTNSFSTMIGLVEQFAKIFRGVESLIVSGEFMSFVGKIADQIKDMLLPPTMEFFSLIKEMGNDAIGLFNKMATGIGSFTERINKALGGMSDISGGRVDKNMLKKGLLWTMILGPGNLMQISGSFALLFASVSGFFIQVVKVALAAAGTIKAAFAAMWAASAGSATMQKLTVIFMFLKAEILKFAALWTSAWWAPFVPIVSMIALISTESGRKIITGISDGFKAAFDVVFKYLELRIENLVIGLVNLFGDTLPGKLAEFVGFTPKWRKDQYEKDKSELRGLVAPLPQGTPGYNKGDHDRFDNTSLMLQGSILAYEKEHHITKRLVPHKIDGLGETIKNAMVAVSDAAGISSKLGSAFDSAKKSVMGFMGSIFDFGDSVRNIDSDLSKLKILAVTPVRGTAPSFEKLQDTTIHGAVRAIESLNALGLDMKVTSAYRNDGGMHSKGRAIDLQATDWGKSDVDSIVNTIRKLIKAGIVEKAILEDGKTGIFKGHAAIGTDGFSFEQTNNERSHIHLQFKEGMEHISSFTDQGIAIVDYGKKSLRDFMSVVMGARGELKTYEGKMKAGDETVKSLLTKFAHMESSMGMVYEGMNSHLKKTTDIVTAAFEEFQSESGHAFGPKRIQELEQRLRLTNQKREEALKKISERYYGPAGPSPDLNQNEQLFQHMMGESESTRNKILMPGMINLASAGGISDMLTMQIQAIQQSANDVRNAWNVAFNMEEYNKNTKDFIDDVKEYSKNILIDAELAKGFELIRADLDLLAQSKERAFDMKMQTEALRATMLQFSGVVSSTEKYNHILNEVISKIQLKGLTMDESITLMESELEQLNLNDETSRAILETWKNMVNFGNEHLKQVTLLRQEYEDTANAVKKMEMAELKANFDKNISSPSKVVREATASRYTELINEGLHEEEFEDIFQAGLKIGISEFDNFGMIVLNNSKQLVGDLRQTFEDGFFDVLSGNFKSLGDMFKNLGDVIKNTILKIISQMAAISATKMILGVDINGQMSGGGILGGLFGDGGIVGMVGNLFGMGGSAGSSVVDGIKTKATNAFGQLATGDFAGAMKSGSDILDLFTKGAGMTTAAKSSGLLGGFQSTAIGKTMSGWTKSVGKFLGTPAGLTTIGAGAFLTQPGRLLGGTKDKTGAAKATYGSWNERLIGMIDRRSADAQEYYMGQPNGNRIGQFQFGQIGYSTWTSGDRWLKGPKERHAATDPSAFQASLNNYYKLLMDAGRKHYENVLKLQRMSEKNQLRALTEQRVFDQKKTDMIRSEYNRYASSMYTAEDKYEKMDDARNRLLDSEYEMNMLNDQIQQIRIQTKYAEMEYSAYIQSMGEDQIAMMRTANEIERQKLKEYEAGTLEWYDAKMSVLQGEKGLADALKAIVKQTQISIDSAMSTIYGLGRVKEPYNATLARHPMAFHEASDYDTPFFNRFKKIEDLRQGKNIDQIYHDFELQWDIGLDELIERLEKESETELNRIVAEYNIGKIKESIQNLLNNTSERIFDQYYDLVNSWRRLDYDTYMSEDAKAEAILQNELEQQGFLKNIAGDINQMIKSGFIASDNTYIQRFATAVSDGLAYGAESIYKSLQKEFNIMSSKSSILGKIQDMEDFDIFNQVLDMDELKEFKKSMGMEGTTEQVRIRSGIFFWDQTKKTNWSDQFEDPYQAMFEHQKQIVLNRIESSEKESDEWFQANSDYMNLMIDNAIRLKEKAEEMNRSLEDMLGKIEETMRMRIAEERETSRGDIMFVDVGATRNSQQLLDRMLAAVKTNDPSAMEMIEEFRKKMMGIGK